MDHALEMSWISTSIDAVDSLDDGVLAGLTPDGNEIFIGKVKTDAGEYVPAKIIPAENKIVYEEDGIEKSTNNMEYLVKTDGYKWVKLGDEGEISNALAIAEYSIGRAIVDGDTVVGKIDHISNELIAYHNGEIVRCKDFYYLAFNPQTSVIKTHEIDESEMNETHVTTTISTTRETSITSSSREKAESDYTKFLRYNEMTEQKFIEMLNRIKFLELELFKYKTGQIGMKEKYTVEQKEIHKLKKTIELLKKEKRTYEKKVLEYETNVSSTKTEVSNLELKIKNFINENKMLLKKVDFLEKEMIRVEKIKIESFTETSTTTSKTDVGRIKYFEETIKSQRERIFELELLIENSKTYNETTETQVTTYKSRIEQQKIQIESFLKKIQNSNTDNEFLIQKVSLLKQIIEKYTLQIESLMVQQANAKNIIASLSAELSRLNSQLSKFQTALSSAYVLNGELMTKVSNMNSLTQFQSTYESRCDILSINLNSIESCAKSFTYSTPSLLEAVGSESYKEYAKTMKMSSSGNLNVFGNVDKTFNNFETCNGQ